MLALAKLYLTVDDLEACQQQCVTLLRMDPGNDSATVVCSLFSVFFIKINLVFIALIHNDVRVSLYEHRNAAFCVTISSMGSSLFFFSDDGRLDVQEE